MLNKLLVMERGLVFLSAPTNGGKTTIIKEITKRKEKAIAISRGFVAPGGIDLITIPAFTDIEIEGEERTAIKLIVEPR